MRFHTTNRWRLFEGPLKLSDSPERATFTFRASDDTQFFCAQDEGFGDEVLAGVGRGELELSFSGFAPLHVRAATRKGTKVWIRYDEVVQDTFPVWGTVFTEPYERVPISPEVEAMMRLARQNEERRMAEMAEFREELRNEIEQERALFRAEQEEIIDDGDRESAPAQRRRAKNARNHEDSASGLLGEDGESNDDSD